MHDEITTVIKAYLKARNDFFEVASSYPDEVGGNDNIIGRIGEYLALRFLREQNRTPVKAKNLSQKGFDLHDGELRITVKLITSENRRRVGARLTEPWDEFLLIYFSTENFGGTIGHLTKAEFNLAGESGKRSKTPRVSADMLKPGGLIGSYGRLKDFESFF